MSKTRKRRCNYWNTWHREIMCLCKTNSGRESSQMSGCVAAPEGEREKNESRANSREKWIPATVSFKPHGIKLQSPHRKWPTCYGLPKFLASLHFLESLLYVSKAINTFFCQFLVLGEAKGRVMKLQESHECSQAWAKTPVSVRWGESVRAACDTFFFFKYTNCWEKHFLS